MFHALHNRFCGVLIATICLAGLAISSTVPLSTARGDDWPQWQGPTRDGVWREAGIVQNFPATGPKILWRVPIAGGYAGPAVVGERVFVTDYLRSAGDAKNDPGARPKLQGQERIHCLDAATGKTLWTHAYDCHYEISYPAGPRATPTVDGSRVYTLGAEGNLCCLNIADGSVAWQLDIKDRFRAPTPIWGFASHPLVVGDRLFILAGGEGSVAVALDKHTGKELWRALSAADAGYAPPTLIEVAGRKQLVVWHPQAVNGLDLETGRVLWSEKLEPNYGMSINPPYQVGNQLFVAGIVNQGFLLNLSATEPTVSIAWRVAPQRGIAPVHSPVIAVGETLYGVDRSGELTAVELTTGKRLWETFAVTTGTRRANSATAFLVKNNEHFYIFSETGDLIIARLTPARYEELGRARLLEPTHEAFGRPVVWSPPAFARRAVFVRNDQEIVCASLAQE